MQLLNQADHRLVSLMGMGGVGKSRLALQVAHELSGEDAFKDGVVFVPLEALSSPALVPPNIAKTLGITFLGSEELLGQVIQHLGDRRMLLILDNFEQLLSGALMLGELLRSCSNLKLLVTSRERLNLEEEVAYLVTKFPLPGEGVVTPEQALANPAVRLFVERAKRANLRFILTEQNFSDVLTLCCLVDGSPLGLELAATWVRLMSPADIAVEIEKSLDFLTTSARNITERHHSFRAVFEHSWQLLSEKEQEVLRKLSVFEGGFRREAAAEVAGATIPLLASLVDKSLLRWMPNGRYDRHPLVYQCTQEKLAEFPEEQSKTQEKHGAYYFRFLEQRVETMWGVKQKAVVAEVDEELGNIRTAWLWAVTKARLGELVAASLPLQRFFDRRNRFQEGTDLFTQAIQAIDTDKPGHNSTLGTLLVDQAWLYFRLGEFERASVLSEKGIGLLQASEKHRGIHTGLNTLGATAWSLGDFAQAKEYFKEALATANTHQTPRAIAGYMGNLGLVEVRLGNTNEASNYFKEALDIKRELEDYPAVVSTLNNLGNLAFQVGDLKKAKTLLEEGLELVERLGFKREVPYLLSSLADVYFNLGSYEEAKALCDEVVTLTEESGSWVDQADALAILGRVATELAAFGEAQTHLKKSLNFFWSVKAMPSVLASLLFFAELKQRQGQPEQAYEWLSLVVNHPATGDLHKTQATRLLMKLETQLSTKPTKKGSTARKVLELDKAVEAILDEV